MISSFRSFLIEEDKTVYFTFGRMNPPTIGHEKLMNELARKSGKNPYRVYLSQSTDNKKNPLDYNYKIKTVRKFFPKHARQVMLDKKVKNVFDAATKLYTEGYKNIYMVVGSDRINEFQKLLNKYDGVKGRHGLYKFNKINDMPACFFSVLAVLAKQYIQSALLASDVQILDPLQNTLEYHSKKRAFRIT